ncbi:MAG: sensor domain-containing diguanylate cyclase [Cyanobacteriota bacterium]
MNFDNNKNDKISELELLNNISILINQKDNINDIIEEVYTLIKDYMGLNNICLWLFNKENEKFRLIYNKKKDVKEDFIDRLNLQYNAKENIFNETPSYVCVDDEFKSYNDLRCESLQDGYKDTKLFLPLLKSNNLLGVVAYEHFELLEKFIIPDNIMLFEIITTQLATAISNERQKKQISMEANVSSATRDIAKIIETQYETDYVIPLMGEILDKYLSNALVYIFLKDKNDKFTLRWPGSYSQKSINPLLDQLNDPSNVVYSENKHAIAIPLTYKSKLIGAIVGDAKIEEIDEIEVFYLKEISKQCSVTLDRAKSYAETVKHATIDALTGLDNRRQLDKRLLQEASVVLRTARPLSVLMTDIDHFKMINDTHGHGVGDYVLREVAKIIIDTCREYDIAGRYGGEEFVVLLPDTSIDGAEKLAERLRKKVEESVFSIGKYISSKADNIKLTLSIGVATYDQTYKNPADIYEEADIALYKAKQEGRNKVVMFSG